MCKITALRIAIFVSLIIIFITFLISYFHFTTQYNDQNINKSTQIETKDLEYIEHFPSNNNTTDDIGVKTSQIANILTKYTFRVMADYDLHYAEVNEIIEYQNVTGKRITLIYIIIPPNHYKDTFSISGYSSDPNSELVAPVENNDPWVVNLEQPLEYGEIIKIKINYNLRLPAQAGSFGYTSKQANFQNWYPYIPPLDFQKGWIYNNYSPIGEYIVSNKADFYLNIRTNREVIVAGAGEELENSDDSISFTHLNARDISFSISPGYQKLSTDLGNVVISAYVFPEEASAGNELVRNTAAALIYYESLYGMKYPHSTLNIIGADFNDGMETDGMYFLSRDYLNDYDGTNRNYMTILSAHETAHQWFYGVVGSNQATEPWLDEALCTFSEILFFEEFYPSEVEWWWNYRVNSYSPAGYVDSSIYQPDSLRAYINSVYLQGVRFLQELRMLVGDEYFISALRNYVFENKNQIADSNDFFKQFELFDLYNLKDIYFSQ